MKTVTSVADIKNEEESQLEPMKYGIKVLRIVGCWPHYDYDAYWKNTLYFIYHSTCLTIYSLFVSSIIIQFFFTFSDIAALADNASLLASVISNGVKISPFIFRKGAVNRCLQTLQYEVIPLGCETKEKDTIFQNTMIYIKRYMMAYSCLYVYTVISWVFTSAVEEMLSGQEDLSTNSSVINRTLPFSAWYPYDVTVSPMYELTYMLQGVQSIFVTSIACFTDCFYLAMVFHASQQFKVLDFSLKNMREIAIERLKARDTRKRIRNVVGTGNEDWNLTLFHHVTEIKSEQHSFTQEEIDVEMSNCLARNIKHHQSIFRFIDIVNGVMSPVMMNVCFTITLILCTITYFASTLSPTSLRFLSMLGFFFTEMAQLFVYCWFCDDLMWKSLMIHEGAYSCHWYYSTSDFKKSIKIMMIRALKPAKITALKFTTLSLELFLALVKMSYSFYTVLRQTNDVEDVSME